MTNTSLSGLSIQAKLLLLYQVFICNTHVFLQLCQYWDTFWTKQADESLYKASISSKRLRLSELQKSQNKAWKIRTEELKNTYEEINGVVHH